MPAPCAATQHGDTTAIVLSGGPDYRRTKRAVGLYEAKQVDRIVFSGAGHGGDSAVRLAREAVRLGVAQKDVIVERAARSTYENLANSCALPGVREAARLVIVTDQHHSYRAYLTARAQCRQPEICSAPAPVPLTAQRRRSEAMKLFAYQLLGRAAWW
ncbi:YdcF family protein [uncultured Salinisphaera sp.]|uniref:YdcF family protein n=1 Tax=uncultured Salinisphaera sp. TaxID=359372 RepID=UPI0032B2E8D6